MSSVLTVAEAMQARTDSDRGRAGAIFSLPRFNSGGTAAAKDTKNDMFVDVARTTLPIEFQGREVKLEAHAYEDETASYQAMAVLHRRGSEGKPLEPGTKRDEIPLVRVHSGCVTGDIFHSLRCDCYAQLQLSLERIIASDLGMIIYLPHHEGRGIGLVNKIKAYAEQDRGLDTVDANLSIGAPVDARDYELPAKILKDLGYEKIRLMSNNPLKQDALERHGITVVEQVRTVTPPSEHNERYLATKRERMAHKL
jgi:GTP cyclohydrolase II/3,4-dihydroxy 2-butanone 4-phosphate synthase/GTP cyclohydrolase II